MGRHNGYFVAQDDALALLSDNFGGAALSNAWTLHEGDGTATLGVSSGELSFEVDVGGSEGEFWYNAEQGPLLHKSITGNFECAAGLRIRNAADDDLPPVTQYRIAGIAAHDPDRATVLNYVHVGLGATGNADLRAEHKSTVDSVSDPLDGTSPGFSSISWPTGEGVVFIRRIGQLFTLEVAATLGGERTLVRSVDRTPDPLPATLQVGPMVYSNQATPDIRGFYSFVTFRSV